MEFTRSSIASDMQRGAEEAAGVLRALSNPSRLVILCCLSEGESSVGTLEQKLGVSQAYMSQQLARLRADGLVSARRDGRMMHYRLADARIIPVLRALHAAFCPDSAAAAQDPQDKPGTAT